MTENLCGPWMGSLRHHWRKVIAPLVVASLLPCSARAETPDPITTSFLGLYSATCLNYIWKLEALKEIGKDLPKLTENLASEYLNGGEGTAWLVPNINGPFVVAIPKDLGLCVVYAGTIDAADVRTTFLEFLKNAPGLYISRLTRDERAVGENGAQTRMISEVSCK